MTALQSYPAYKDSGVEWLGDVPEHWEVRRLKHWLEINRQVLSTPRTPIRLTNSITWISALLQQAGLRSPPRGFDSAAHPPGLGVS